MDQPPPYNPHMPKPGYPPQASMAPPPVVIVQHSAPAQFGDQPAFVTCTNCNSQVQTRVEFKAGSLTYLAAFGLAFFVWCGCCLIPCCVDSCKDAHHFCPNCNAQLGVYKRL